MERNFDNLPIELKTYLMQYLDQNVIIRRLNSVITDFETRIRQLEGTNRRLTLINLQQLADIRNLEFILANGLDEEGRILARQLDFDNLSDSSDEETVWDASDDDLDLNGVVYAPPSRIDYDP